MRPDRKRMGRKTRTAGRRKRGEEEEMEKKEALLRDNYQVPHSQIKKW